MIRFSVFFLALCVFLPSVEAKKVRRRKPRFVLKGVVLEKGRRDPIEGVGVFIRKLRIGGYSDEKGRFTLKVPAGTWELRVRPIGFLSQNRKIVIKGDTTLSIYLERDGKSSLQTVVRAKRVRKTAQQVTLSRKEIRTGTGAVGNDPFRSVQDMPGVARDTSVGGDIRVRGAAPRDTGFFIDGHRLPYLYHFGGGPAVFNIRFLENLSFFPGGAPVEFGRLTAGLVAVDSRDPRSNQLHGEAYVELAQAGIFLQIPLGKHLSLALGFNRSYLEVVQLFLPFLLPKFEEIRYWDYQAKLTFHYKRWTATLFVFGSDDLVDFSGELGDAYLTLLGADPLFVSTRFLRAIALVKYKHKRFSFRLSLATGFDQDLYKDDENKSDTVRLPIEMRAELRVPLHRNFLLRLGSEIRWERSWYTFQFQVNEFAGFPKPSSYRITFKGETSADLLAPAFFLGFEWFFLDRKLKLVSGVRTDSYTFLHRFLWSIEPRLSASYQINSAWSVNFITGLFSQPPQVDRWVENLGNPDLLLQRSIQVASGFEYRGWKRLRLRAQVFYSWMYDRITGSGRVIKVLGKTQRENYNNNGTGRAYGLELQAKFRPTKSFAAAVAYTFSRAERGNINSSTMSLYSYDQPHILSLSGRYLFGKGWSLSLRFRLVSGRPTRAIRGVFFDADRDRYIPMQGESGSARYPTFHQLDLRIEKKWVFNLWKLAAYFDFQNVYFARNAEAFSYQFDYGKLVPRGALPTIPTFGVRGEF